jgi:multiple sugar transport system permease protein
MVAIRESASVSGLVVGRRRTAWRVFNQVGRATIIVVVVGFGLLGLVPLYWMLTNAVATPKEALDTPPDWFPTRLTLSNFSQALHEVPLIHMLLNSIEVTSIIVVGSLLVGSLAAYGFARLRFRARGALFGILLAGIMIPAQVAVVPIFVLMRHLHLINQLPSIWLPALVNVLVIFVLRQYIMSIPRDLDEAAWIDGAGHFRIWWGIILPLSRPALLAATVFVAQAYWNDFFWPSVFLSTPSHMTLPVGLVELQSDMGGGAGATVIFAAIVLVVLPVMVLMLLCQRWLIQGISLTANR